MYAHGMGLYCHILYIFKPWPGLFNNGVPIYREYLLKGEALHDVFILLVCLNATKNEFTSGFKINCTGPRLP
jgi:hypothetical protein